MFTPARPYVNRNADAKAIAAGCKKALDNSSVIDQLPGWCIGALKGGGLKARQSALWVLYIHELEASRGDALGSWVVEYLPVEYQQALNTPLGAKPSYAERKSLEDALWAAYRLERDAESTPADSLQRASNRSKGKRR